MYEFLWLYMTMHVWHCFTLHDYVCLCMTMYDIVWICMTVYDFAWPCVTMYNFVLLFNDYALLCMPFMFCFHAVFCDSIWLFLILFDYIWFCLTLCWSVWFNHVWPGMFNLLDSSCSILFNFVSICLNLLDFVWLSSTHVVMHKFCACLWYPLRAMVSRPTR